MFVRSVCLYVCLYSMYVYMFVQYVDIHLEHYYVRTQLGNLSDGAAEKDVAAAVATGLASQALSNENVNNGETLEGSASAGKYLILD